jgi:hypothetical protein
VPSRNGALYRNLSKLKKHFRGPLANPENICVDGFMIGSLSVAAAVHHVSRGSKSDCFAIGGPFLGSAPPTSLIPLTVKGLPI